MAEAQGVLFDVPQDPVPTCGDDAISTVAKCLARCSVHVEYACTPCIKDRWTQRKAQARLLQTLWSKHPDATGVPVMLWHTGLGRPLAVAPDSHEQLANTHISFTHDGLSLIGAMVIVPNCAGIGIDLVHLPRIVGKGEAYAERLAYEFMDYDERQFALRAPVGQYEARVAAHFSLMESASKAFGTGLRLPFGGGGSGSLQRREIAVRFDNSGVLFWRFGSKAKARMQKLGGTQMEGQVASGKEFLVSAALLWMDK